MEIEGRKRGHFWTFNIVRDDDRVGVPISLVRCSTESHNVFEKWLTVNVYETKSPSVSVPETAYPARTKYSGCACSTAQGRELVAMIVSAYKSKICSL